MQAVILRNQRSKSKLQSTVININDQEQPSQPDQQQLKMLKAMKFASQEDHRYYASNDKTVVEFPEAAIKANAVRLNPSSDSKNQNNPSRPFSLASSSHLSIRSDYGEASLEDEEVLICSNCNSTNIANKSSRIRTNLINYISIN